MYLIGSRGSHSEIRKNIKPDSDWDVVLEEGETLPDYGDDCSDLNTLEVCDAYYGGTINTIKGRFKIINPLGQMLLKRSHLHRPYKFAKHIREYHWYKSKYECLTKDIIYRRLLVERIKLTKEKYPDRTPSLNKTKQDFFNDQVIKYYDHDDLHRVTCYYEQPIFELLKSDSEKVWCSKKKWDQLKHLDKIHCVAEECFVIALERFIIPKIQENKKHPPVKFAYQWALEKVCTTLTSGWFRDFAIENWPEISNLKLNFLEDFKNARQSKKLNQIT